MSEEKIKEYDALVSKLINALKLKDTEFELEKTNHNNTTTNLIIIKKENDKIEENSNKLKKEIEKKNEEIKNLQNKYSDHVEKYNNEANASEAASDANKSTITSLNADKIALKAEKRNLEEDFKEQTKKMNDQIKLFKDSQNSNENKYKELKESVDAFANSLKSRAEFANIKNTPTITVDDGDDGTERLGDGHLLLPGGLVKKRVDDIEAKIQTSTPGPKEDGFVKNQVESYENTGRGVKVTGGKRKTKRRNKKNVRRTIKNKNR